MDKIKNILKTSKKYFSSFNSCKPGKKRFSYFDKKIQNLRYPVYYYLLLGNCCVYVAWNSYLISERFLKNNFMLSKLNIGQGRIYTLLTHSFTHINIFHLLSNGIGLYYIGKLVEQSFGGRILLNLYILGAVSGGLLHLMTTPPNDPSYAIGASSSVSAIMSYCFLSFPHYTFYIFPFPFPIKAWVLGTFFFFYSWNMTRGRFNDGIGHAGHLGGFLAGAFYYLATRRTIVF